MRTFGAALFAVLLSCAVTFGADDTAMKKLAKKNLEAMNEALIKDDFAKVVDMTHPKVIEMVGGRDKMIEAMTSGTKEMKAKGVKTRSTKVGEPSDIVVANSQLYLVVPFEMDIKVPTGKLTAKSFVIGVSDDKGKSWKFINGDEDMKKIKTILPNLPDSLKLPERQKPVLEKE